MFELCTSDTYCDTVYTLSYTGYQLDCTDPANLIDFVNQAVFITTVASDYILDASFNYNVDVSIESHPIIFLINYAHFEALEYDDDCG